MRDLMDFKPGGRAVPLDEVQSINEIRKRFLTPGMSLGALSPEAHGALNIAMNRIGAKSVSGEGGEGGGEGGGGGVGDEGQAVGQRGRRDECELRID